MADKTGLILPGSRDAPCLRRRASLRPQSLLMGPHCFSGCPSPALPPACAPVGRDLFLFLERSTRSSFWAATRDTPPTWNRLSLSSDYILLTTSCPFFSSQLKNSHPPRSLPFPPQKTETEHPPKRGYGLPCIPITLCICTHRVTSAELPAVPASPGEGSRLCSAGPRAGPSCIC